MVIEGEIFLPAGGGDSAICRHDGVVVVVDVKNEMRESVSLVPAINMCFLCLQEVPIIILL